MNKKKLRKYTGVTTEVQVNKLAMREEETGTTHGEKTQEQMETIEEAQKQNVNITDTEFFLKRREIRHCLLLAKSLGSSSGDLAVLGRFYWQKHYPSMQFEKLLVLFSSS